MTETTTMNTPRTAATAVSGLSGLPRPTNNPHDGERPLWWLFSNEFAASLIAPQVRGVGAESSEPSPADRKTMLTVLQVIRTARRQLKDPDPKTAREGAFNLLKVVSYLAGFVGSKPWVPQSSALVPLMMGVPDSVTLEAQLDAIEQALDELNSPTRGLLALGFGGQLIVIGCIGLAAAAAIKYGAAQMPDTVPD
jgi:hypothetical protein